MSTDALEVRYRRLLRSYPQGWREHREEEVLAVLMEGAREEGRAHPTRAETWDLTRHAAAHRLDELVTPASRRRIGVLALLSGVTLSTVGLALGEVLPWIGPALAPGVIYSPADFPRLPPSPGTGIALYLLWLVAAALVSVGRARDARGLLLGSVALATSSGLIASHTGTLEPPLWFRGVLVLFALLASITPLHRTRSGVVGSATAVAVGAATLTVLARPWAVISFGEPGYGYYRLFGVGLRGMGVGLLWAMGPALVLVLLLATRRRLRPWVGPALVAGLPWGLFAALAGVGPTPRYGVRAAATALCLAAVVGLAWAAGNHVGRRTSGRATTG